MRLGLEGRVALVTGASKGIGRAITEQLTAEGALVLAVARKRPELVALQRRISSKGGRVEIYQADLAAAGSAKASIQSAVRLFGALDILVNNVGGAGRCGDFDELTDSDWRAAFELNVMSMIRMVRGSLPYLRKSSAPRIVNIASISGMEPGVYNPHYAASKAAMINAGKCLANQLAKEAILVNTVCPGTVSTPAWEQVIRSAAKREGMPVGRMRTRLAAIERSKTPLDRLGTPDDVARFVVFLASPISDWTTGSCFHINGGKLRAIS